MTQKSEELKQKTALIKFVREQLEIEEVNKKLQEAYAQMPLKNGAGERILEAGNKSITESIEKIEEELERAMLNWVRSIDSALRREVEEIAAGVIERANASGSYSDIEEVIEAFPGAMKDMVGEIVTEKIVQPLMSKDRCNEDQ